MAKILNGTIVALEIRKEVSSQAREFQHRHGFPPGLAAVLVGDNPASAIYVRNKGKACQEAGILSETFHLPQGTPQERLLELVQKLNEDSRFQGILVQLPLPPQIDERRVISALDPSKDVDCLHPLNVGKLASGEPTFIPVTPSGIQQLLLRNGYSPEGKQMVICGRSNIVGKPLAILMMQKLPGANATVTVCHTGTRNMADITRQADILVVASGRPNTVTADMVRQGVVVVDVGINRVPDPSSERGYKLVGDVDFDGVFQKAEAITPVPGGVGPMTIAMLLVNTIRAAQLRAGEALSF